jgi:L-lactate dehydrogenase complex protein LldE
MASTILPDSQNTRRHAMADHAGAVSLRNYPKRPAAVYFYATCLVDQFDPGAGLDSVRLLEREGIRVIFPADQTCCGQPAYTSGYPDEARAVASRQLELFPEPWPIVVPSGSCAAMMRHHQATLFAADPVRGPQARALADRIFELTEFLVCVVGFQRADTGPPCKVTLHTSCHARREMGVAETSHALLAGLAQVQVLPQVRETECCGFGGTFSVRHPAISEAMVTDKVEALCATGADEVLSADCGCLFNILGRAEHLDRAVGRSPPRLPGGHIASFLWERTGGTSQ